MKKLSLYLSCLAFASYTLAKPPTVFTTSTSAEIVIEADGRVSDVKFVDAAGEALQASLAASIRHPTCLHPAD